MGKKNRIKTRFQENHNKPEKYRLNMKVMVMCGIALLLIGLIIILTNNIKTKSYPYQPENIEIQVTTNDDGAQEPNAGVQKDVMTNEGAATVDEITGGAGNPANQGQGIDEMLKDKEIEVNK